MTPGPTPRDARVAFTRAGSGQPGAIVTSPSAGTVTTAGAVCGNPAPQQGGVHTVTSPVLSGHLGEEAMHWTRLREDEASAPPPPPPPVPGPPWQAGAALRPGRGSFPSTAGGPPGRILCHHLAV